MISKRKAGQCLIIRKAYFFNVNVFNVFCFCQHYITTASAIMTSAATCRHHHQTQGCILTVEISGSYLFNWQPLNRYLA